MLLARRCLFFSPATTTTTRTRATTTHLTRIFNFQHRFRTGKRKKMTDWENLSDDLLKVYSDKPKLSGYDLYRSLGSPKYLVAPMVDQSELAFRMLCKNYGAQMAYTPMFHSKVFLEDVHYRYDHFQTCPDEVPLLIQLCGNDPQVVLNCAKCCLKIAAVQGNSHVIAGVDLNLGCPQRIAKKGFYGSYLMDNLALVKEIVSTLHRELPVPVTVKIRIFPKIEDTFAYVDMLVEAGAQMIVVHGRLRDQRGHNQGLADWDVIKQVRERHPNIPIFANGNVRYYQDVIDCMEHTGVDGVMSACGLLDNPALFANMDNKDRLELAYEYLQSACKYPVPSIAHAKAHLFHFLHHYVSLPYNADLRRTLSGNKCRTAEEYIGLVDEIASRYQKYGDGPGPEPARLSEEETTTKTEEVDYEDLEGVNLFESTEDQACY